GQLDFDVEPVRAAQRLRQRVDVVPVRVLPQRQRQAGARDVFLELLEAGREFIVREQGDELRHGTTGESVHDFQLYRAGPTGTSVGLPVLRTSARGVALDEGAGTVLPLYRAETMNCVRFEVVLAHRMQRGSGMARSLLVLVCTALLLPTAAVRAEAQ